MSAGLNKKTLLGALIFLLFSITGVSTVYGHGGGLDSQGGHNCNVGSWAGTYHCHQAWGPGCGAGTSVGSGSSSVTPKCIDSDFYSLSKRNWAKIQKQLKNAGYSPGVIDGKPGPKTLAALRSYENDYGLSRSTAQNVRTSTIESLNAFC